MKDFIKKLKQSIPYILVILFIMTLPVVWSEDSLLDASLLSRQRFLSFFLPILFIAFTVMCLKGFRFCFKNKLEKIIFSCIIAFMAMHIISFVNVINQHEATFHIAKEFSFCLYFFFVYQLLKKDHSWRNAIIKSILVSSAIFILIGVAQLANSDFSKYQNATSHQSYFLNKIMEGVFSTCSNKNLFSSLLFITLPVSIYGIFSLKESGKKSPFWFLLSVAITFTSLIFIALLLSRTVFAAILTSLFCSLILLYIYIIKIKPQETETPISNKTKYILIGFPIVVAVGLFLIVSLTDTKIEQTITERINLTLNPEKYGYRDNKHGESSVAMRTIIWGKTIDMIKKHPIVGSGAGQWQIVIPKYGVDEFNAELQEGSLTFQRPHNDYLWFASEVGILGLVFYLVFYFGIIIAGIYNIRKSKEKNVVTFNILAISALIGWMIISGIDYPHERIEHNIFYLTICALVFADYIKLQNDSDKKTSYNTIKTFSIMAVGLIICIVNFKLSNQYFKGEANGRKILEAHYKLNWDRVLKFTQNIDKQEYTLNNYTVPMYYYRGLALSMKNLDEDAIIEFNKALELHPYHILTLNAKGTSLCNLKRYDEAIEYFQQVLNISGKNTNALYNMAISYFDKKDFKTAFDYISKVPFDLKRKPANFDNSYITIIKFTALSEKDLYNQDNLAAWLKNDNKIIASIRKFHAGNCTSLSEVLIPELGPKEN